MSSLMTKLGTRQGWIEPYNWDPAARFVLVILPRRESTNKRGETDSAPSPACNCKPNWPENYHHNPYGAQCDCDNDNKKKYIYHMTKDARSYRKAQFENWEPNVDWGTSKWNYQGYSKKRALELEGKNEEVARGEVADGDEKSSYDKEWLEEAERKAEEYQA